MESFQSLVSYLKETQAAKYLPAASVAILIYDYGLTLDDEVQQVWKAPFTYVTFLYFFTRYLPFVDSNFMLLQSYLRNPPIGTCRVLGFLRSYFFVTGVIVAEVILIVRTSAIWANNRTIIAILVILLIGYTVCVSYTMRNYISSIVFVQSPTRAIPGCFAFKANKLIYVNYIYLLVYETIVVSLTLYKAAYDAGMQRSLLYYTIIRDGLLYYLFLLAITIVNIVVLATLRGAPGICAIGLHRILHSIFAARLILNIRKAAKKRLVSHTSKDTAFVFPTEAISFDGGVTGATELSELEFATGSPRWLLEKNQEGRGELDVMGRRIRSGREGVEWFDDGGNGSWLKDGALNVGSEDEGHGESRRVFMGRDVPGCIEGSRNESGVGGIDGEDKEESSEESVNVKHGARIAPEAV